MRYDPTILLWLVVFIFLSRSLSIVKKFGLPLVVGEILSGVVLGQFHTFGYDIFYEAANDPVIHFLAELGAIILMFEIGLESKFSDLRHNFKSGIKIAFIGSSITFVSGFLVGWFLIPTSTISLSLLMGTISAATATGISAKTFKEMGILRTKEVKIVLVASVLDELMSIIIFALISAMIITTSYNIKTFSVSIFQLVCFFVFAAVFGNWITPIMTKWSTRIHAGINMKIGVLLIVCFLFAWVAHIFGLATVVGSFIGGLILDQVYFKKFSQSKTFHKLKLLTNRIKDLKLKDDFTRVIVNAEERSLEELLKPLSHVFVPVFFIYLGLLLDIRQLFSPTTLIITLALLTTSILGRVISGYFIKDKNINHLILGLGMVPIGEAGLIFAMFGESLGIISIATLSAIISSVVIAAIITPLLIKYAINKYGIHHG